MRLYPAPEHGSFVFGDSPKRALLLHGFPGTPWELRGIGELLADLGYEAHGPLLPGFGPQIDSLGERDWRDWQEDASRALRFLEAGAEEVLLVGYSMGAALATLTSVDRPPAGRTRRRMVLINPFSGVSRPLGALMPLLTPFVSTYRPFVRADFDDPWIREVVGRVLPDLDLDDLEGRERLRREACIPLTAIDQVRQLGAEAWRRAPTARIPALVLQARHDKVVSPRRTRRFTRRLGGPTRFLETAGGHVMIWPGKPGFDELVRELKRFLVDRPATSRVTVAAARGRTP